MLPLEEKQIAKIGKNESEKFLALQRYALVFIRVPRLSKKHLRHELKQIESLLSSNNHLLKLGCHFQKSSFQNQNYYNIKLTITA